MSADGPVQSPVPRWLRLVLASDRAGSAWYIGTGFFFAPVLAVLSPWPTVTAVLWALIALAGLVLGLLGIAMAVGLARILRSGKEIPEEYWLSLIHSR
ncbi:hypothetical protein [Mycobacterium conspicuum]|uniref:Uncharacterized protein n=1 Tax=Mycobacterium conspicuum TaxID=44010 RepID=A0A1X1T297_9MYCO|nr:hypothetical protein [Mycobacterium conspicuum]ORV38391.1 hypothetical protein AWC00_19930 [Mycobacterium conspicuum]BBZ39701.1 hypothetical protein MCNS_27640 [Mycobacterium conspicuum]